MRIYSVHDKLAQEYGPIWEARNDLVATRQYKQLMTDVTSKQDYDLYCVGEFDREEGYVSDLKHLVLVGQAMEDVE